MFVRKNVRKKAPIVFGETIRYDGLLYVRISEYPEHTRRWRTESATKGGVLSPSKVIELTDGSVWVCAPILNVRQHVMVRALDADGRVLACEMHVVRPIVSKLQSVAKTFSKAKPTATLRARLRDSYEGPATFSDFGLSSLGKIDGRWRDHLYTTLTLVDTKENLESAAVSVHAINHSGTEVPATDIVVMGDVTEVLSGSGESGLAIRKVRVSIAMDYEELSICLWACLDKTGQVGPIVEFEPYEMHSIRIRQAVRALPAEISADYESWFLSNRAGSGQLAFQRADQERFDIRPLFSVVIPLYYTPVDFLTDVLDSLVEQSYPRLEIILVNSTPDDQSLADCIDSYAQKDSRVNIVTLPENKGITENTNAGIAVANGDFVCFMDHDDLIERDLFYWYAKEVNDCPETILMYCDEDLFIDGHYQHPFFKPDWSEVFLESNNYVCHLLAVRRSCLEQIETPTRELDGAQDHNMSLAIGGLPGAKRHVRRVLYHWRSHPNSTAQNANEKPESYLAGKTAIDRHYRQMGFPAEVESIVEMPHCYRTVLAERQPSDVSVVLWDDGENAYDELPDQVREMISARREGDESWSQAIRRALDQSTGEFVLLLSRKTTGVSDHCLGWLRTYVERDDVGVAMPVMKYPDGFVCNLGMALVDGPQLVPVGNLLTSFVSYARGYNVLSHDVTSVDPRCFMAKRALLDRMGDVDFEDLAIGCLDVCLAARIEGRATILVADCYATVEMGVGEVDAPAPHIRYGTVGDWQKLTELWPGGLDHDGYYHRMLSDDGLYRLRCDKGWVVPPKPRVKVLNKLKF